MTKLVANNVTVSVARKNLIDDISLAVAPGKLQVILGPNGAGKTTLLRALLGICATDHGTVQLDGQTIENVSAAERAKQVAYLPQQRPLAWPTRVYDVVALGRFAHGAAVGRLAASDKAAVEQALAACRLLELADRRVDTLSGGELARVHFARVLATGAPLLLADEPSAALDPRHQLGVAQLLRNYVDQGGGALVVLHDVSLAARIADELIWLRDGQVVSIGSCDETLSSATLASVYGIDARVIRDSEGPVVVVDRAV